MSIESKNIKEMAELLKQGATLTALACPECSSPLFRMKSGELWCASCEKQVIVVKEGEERKRIESEQINDARSMLLEKIKDIMQKMKDETDFEKLRSLSTILSSLLENLEKTERIIEN